MGATSWPAAVSSSPAMTREQCAEWHAVSAIRTTCRAKTASVGGTQHGQPASDGTHLVGFWCPLHACDGLHHSRQNKMTVSRRQVAKGCTRTVLACKRGIALRLDKRVPAPAQSVWHTSQISTSCLRLMSPSSQLWAGAGALTVRSVQPSAGCTADRGRQGCDVLNLITNTPTLIQLLSQLAHRLWAMGPEPDGARHGGAM